MITTKRFQVELGVQKVWNLKSRLKNAN